MRHDGVGDLATAVTARPLFLAASAVVGPIAATCCRVTQLAREHSYSSRHTIQYPNTVVSWRPTLVW